MPKLPRFAGVDRAVDIFKEVGKEFAVVKNPTYIHPPFEFYPLAPKINQPRGKIIGIVQDMDGTTTTTEALCLHSLEYTVRKITGREDRIQWSGLDREEDYPHIIGNSTTRHVEYLINKYREDIKTENFKKSYLTAALWTLALGKDRGRKREVRNNITNMGLRKLLEDKLFYSIIQARDFKTKKYTSSMQTLLEKYKNRLSLKSFTDKVRAAVDIYYQRYHEILAAIDEGKGEKLSQELLLDSKKTLIEPMPAVAIFLALVKGWLGEKLALFYEEMRDYLVSHPQLNYEKEELAPYRSRLVSLGRHFQKNPAKIAVVTSSIEYEANIVLTEVFNVICRQIESWPIAEEDKRALIDRFDNYHNVFDSFITASDSSEIRLKPHRDLYSIALHQMGIPKTQFGNVIGFEDSESGTIAIRAAGIGLCVAVPFADTRGHDLSAASFILHGGLPEAILAHNVFTRIL